MKRWRLGLLFLFDIGTKRQIVILVWFCLVWFNAVRFVLICSRDNNVFV